MLYQFSKIIYVRIPFDLAQDMLTLKRPFRQAQGERWCKNVFSCNFVAIFGHVSFDKPVPSKVEPCLE
jgi:hypothetical protein